MIPYHLLISINSCQLKHQEEIQMVTISKLIYRKPIVCEISHTQALSGNNTCIIFFINMLTSTNNRKIRKNPKQKTLQAV